MRIGLAFKAFFKILGDDGFAERVQTAYAGAVLPAPQAAAPLRDAAAPTATARSAVAPGSSAPVAPAPVQSDAVALLAVLQRESRLIDLVMQPLDGHADAEIGAAARDVLRDARAALNKTLALAPLNSAAEGSVVQTPTEVDAAKFRLTGVVSGSPPYRGELVHAGWIATKLELPKFTGSPDAARVVAPAEIEVR